MKFSAEDASMLASMFSQLCYLEQRRIRGRVHAGW